MASIAHYRRKISERGISDIIARRLQWYKRRLQINNWMVGRWVELSGNQIMIGDIKLDVNNPLILTIHKSTMFFGFHESAERELATKHLDRSLPTIEIGGSIGGVSCSVNRLLENPSAHVVVECSPPLLSTLEKNRDLNDCHFAIEPYALAYGSETISFGTNDFLSGNVFQTASKQVTVPTTTLLMLIDKYDFKTINLISDCEGAEVGLLETEADVMRDRVKWFIVEIHPEYVGDDAISKMLSDLEQIDFKQRDSSRGNVIAFENLRL